MTYWSHFWAARVTLPSRAAVPPTLVVHSPSTSENMMASSSGAVTSGSVMVRGTDRRCPSAAASARAEAASTSKETPVTWGWTERVSGSNQASAGSVWISS